MKNLKYFEEYLNEDAGNEKIMILSNKGLKELPELPEDLEVLDCSYNQLTSLPELPESLKKLFCGYNKIEKLPDLPESIEIINCQVNDLTDLPELPESLKSLNCMHNRMTISKIKEWEKYCEENGINALFLPAVGYPRSEEEKWNKSRFIK